MREQARQAYRDSIAAGVGLSGKTLGERFGRSERWGRERIAETRPTLPPPDRGVANEGHGSGRGSAGAAAASELARQPGCRPASGRRGWAPGLAQQIGSAVWPIGLLLSVEVLFRVRWAPGAWWALARYGGAGTVAVGSAIISYGHLHEVLIAWNYGPLGAAVGPLVLDGLMVVSGFALLAMSRSGEDAAGSESADSVTDSVTTATDSGATDAGGGADD